MRNPFGNFCVCALLASALCSVLAAQEKPRSDDLVVDADSMTFNRQTNLFEARRPRIVQGNMHVEADESVATGVC